MKTLNALIGMTSLIATPAFSILQGLARKQGN